MTIDLRNGLALALLALTIAGCSSADGEFADEIGVDSSDDFSELGEAIRGGTDVPYNSRYARSTVYVGQPSCTGTIIGPRHVLSAAHCGAIVGDYVGFYVGADPSGVRAKVSRIYRPESVTATDWYDVNGKFADFVVLYLDRTIPSTSLVAKLAPSWPGNNVTMMQVGQGDHDGIKNTVNILRYRSSKSYSASNAAGHVLVEASLDGGDSGGPIYTTEGSRLVVHGDAWGNVFEWAWRSSYTSTSFHLHRIAEAAGHVGRSNWDYVGNDIARIDNTTWVNCMAECLANDSCRAYTLVPVVPLFGTCFLKSGTGSGGRAAAGMISGSRITTGACDAAGGVCRL